MEVEKRVTGFFPRLPIPIATIESLKSACRKADEIYINALFPNALYGWENFPKVSGKNLKMLVARDANEKLYSPEELFVEHKIVKNVSISGITKQQVCYVGIPEANLFSFWNKFENFHNKIKHITTLTNALSSMVSIEKPAGNFMVVWVGESSTIMSVNSSEGLVKTSRDIAVGISKTHPSSDLDSLFNLSEKINKEIIRTFTYFKQTFRESEISDIYLLGNPYLRDIIQQDPLKAITSNIYFDLTKNLVNGISDIQINETIHLTSNLFLNNDEFNFIPRREIRGRSINKAFKFIYLLIGLLIMVAALWSFFIRPVKSEKLEIFNQKFAYLQSMQNQIKGLRKEVNELKPFEGWKKFYENTYKNQPRWNMFLSELTSIVAQDIVIENMTLLPDERGAVRLWSINMSGGIRAENWSEGLKTFRQFGKQIQSSSFFKVASVHYLPENPEDMESEAKMFDFHMILQLL